MNPNLLLTFVVFAKLKSITRAAEALNLGQPAISGQLKQLQDIVGEPLYERFGHKIRLTQAGEGLFEVAERLSIDYKAAKDYIKSLQRVNIASLRLGSTTTISSYYLPRHVVKLQTLYPGIHVSMSAGNTSEIAEKLIDLDLAFIEGPMDADSLPTKFKMQFWKEDEIVLIVHEAHEIALKYPDAVPLEVFTQYQVIWREPGSGARQVVERALIEAGIEVPVNIVVMGVSGVKESVRAGLGIGFASIQAMRHEDRGLVSRRIAYPLGLRWQLNIIAPQEKMRSRACQKFIDLVMEDEGEV